MKEKAQALLAIAKELAETPAPEFRERHRLIHWACATYRVRYGKRATPAVIEYALYKLTW